MTSLLLLSLAGLIYLFMVTRVWQASRKLAVGMMLFMPTGLYVLVRYWHDRELGVRVPLLAAFAMFGASAALLAPDLRRLEVYASEAEAATTPPAPKARAGDGPDDRLRLSIALARLPQRAGRVEIEAARAAIEVPPHFRFVDRAGLQALYEEIGAELSPSSVGWLVHDEVDLGAEEAWFVEVEWLGDGYVGENGFAARPRAQVLAEAQNAIARLSERQGGEAQGFSLVRYAEEPAFDAERDSATWVEELAYAGDAEHRLDCYAAKLGRSGALLFSILEVGMRRQELCLRSVRLVAGRTRFDPGQAYADHSSLFDRKANYDLAAMISGAAALREL